MAARAALAALALLLGLGLPGPGPVGAQEQADGGPELPQATEELDAAAAEASSILIISMERLMRDTDAARSIQDQAARIRSQIQSGLGARREALRQEEQELVELRGQLDVESFATRVAAFEAEVRALKRESQERGSLLQKALFEATEELQRRLRPELIAIMQERRAAVMLDARDIVLNARVLDVTEEAIERVNAATPRIDVRWPPPE